MDKSLQERMGRKVDICYVLAKENLPFRKYPAIHELESRHGVDLGQSYATKDSAKSFTHYIAKVQRSAFIESLSTTHFYSFLMDGTTDAGNIEEELAQQARKQYTPREIAAEESDSDSEDKQLYSLSEWDTWFSDTSSDSD